jgi:F-type H+-transporting ATPase subunit epsilon
MPGLLQVELVSPERILYSGDATMVVTRTLEGGEIAFQPGHAPFLGALTENHTRIYLPDGQVQDLAVHGGFVQVTGTKVSILSDDAELAQDIDVAAVERRKAELEDHLRQVEEEDAEAEAELRRTHARLAAAGGLQGPNR